MRKSLWVSTLLVSLSVTGCSSDTSVTEESALINIACVELEAYNDLIDAGDEAAANTHWNKVLQIQGKLNGKPNADEQISNNDWGFICSQ